MNTNVKLDELVDAYHWASAGDGLCASAYLSRTTGTFIWVGDGAEDPVPADIEDASKYLQVPDKYELDLGRSLALGFVSERLPHLSDDVYDFFRRRGAYSKFKALLERTGQLDAWYAYEEAAIAAALREWCEENGLVVAD